MKQKCICFAYFADGEFIGWYSDSFGSITKNSPKIYNYSEEQVSTVMSNFQYKMKAINTSTLKTEKTKVAALNLLKFSSEDLLRGKNVELKIVKCPIYDGPNPDFDEEKYNIALEENKKKLINLLKENGIDWEDGPSLQRFKIVDEFRKKFPIPCNNWIYADYQVVKEWALNEPNEFIQIK